MPYEITDGSNFTSEEKVEQAFKAGLDRVQTDLKKEWFQEPKVIKTILPNQTYKNTITSWNEIENYLLIDRVTDSTIPKITNITVNQVLGTSSKFKNMKYTDLTNGKTDIDGSTYVCRPSSGDGIDKTTDDTDKQYEGLSPGMFTRYHYFNEKITGNNGSEQDEPNNALLTYSTDLNTINSDRIIGNTKDSFLTDLETHVIAVDIISPPSDWTSVDSNYIEDYKHPFLQIYLSVPTFSSYSADFNDSDNISFFNPVIENALGDAEGYLYLIEGWKNTAWEIIHNESTEKVFFNNTSGIVSVYGQQENILDGPKLSGIFAPLVSYIKYTGETLADGIISQGTTLPKAELHKEKDLFINTTEDKIYRLNSDKNWILIGGTDILAGDGISKDGNTLSVNFGSSTSTSESEAVACNDTRLSDKRHTTHSLSQTVGGGITSFSFDGSDTRTVGVDSTVIRTIGNHSMDGNLNISGHDGSTNGLQLGGTLVTATAAELNTLAGVTAGTASVNKALIVDGNKNITELGNVTTTGEIKGKTGNFEAITLTVDPTAENHAVPRSYVDSVVQGLDVKDSVRVATTGNIIDLTNVNAIDGESLVNGDRVLVKDQTSAKENGIYVYNNSILTRTPDFDHPAEVKGAFTFVEKGDTNAGLGFVQTSSGVATIDADNITFTQFSGAGEITAGTGISKDGNALSLDIATATTLGGIKVGNNLSISDGSLSIHNDFINTLVKTTGTQTINGSKTFTSLTKIYGGATTAKNDGLLIGTETELSQHKADGDLLTVYRSSTDSVRLHIHNESSGSAVLKLSASDGTWNIVNDGSALGIHDGVNRYVIDNNGNHDFQDGDMTTTGTISSTGDYAKLTIRNWHINDHNGHLNFNYDTSINNSVDGTDNFVFQIDKNGQLRMPCIHHIGNTTSKRYFLWKKSCDSYGFPQLEMGLTGDITDNNIYASNFDTFPNVIFKNSDTLFKKRIWAYNTDVLSTNGFKIWHSSNEHTTMTQGSNDGITTFNLKTNDTEGSFKLKTTTSSVIETSIADFKTTGIEFFQPLNIHNNLTIHDDNAGDSGSIIEIFGSENNSYTYAYLACSNQKHKEQRLYIRVEDTNVALFRENSAVFYGDTIFYNVNFFDPPNFSAGLHIGPNSTLADDSVYQQRNILVGSSNYIYNNETLTTLTHGNQTYPTDESKKTKATIASGTGIKIGSKPDQQYKIAYQTTSGDYDIETTEVRGDYMENTAVFGSGHSLVNGESNGGWGYVPQERIMNSLIYGEKMCVSNTENCLIGGRYNLVSGITPYHYKLLGSSTSGTKSRYSIIAGSYIGYYSPLICDYSLVVGYRHYGTFDSTTDPDNYYKYMSKYNLSNYSGVHPTILFAPRKFEYCLVVGKQHVVKHDYVSLLGNSQHSKETGALQTSGKIWCQGGTVNSSDQRIKTDIVDASLDESFNIINSLKVRKYKYTENYRKSRHNLPSDTDVWGLIAQEVEEIYPEAVITTSEEILTDPDKLEDEEDIDEKDLDEENKHVKILEKIENFKSLDKQKLIFPMIGTIQKLIKIVTEQDERIKKLESKEII